MKADYTNLDAVILARIALASNISVPVTFYDISNNPAVFIEAGLLITDEQMRPAWRIVDSRLQALRKAGKIESKRIPGVLGWMLAVSA